MIRAKERGSLTVCMGLPASGKSTWVKQHKGKALVVCADSIRIRGTSARAMFGKMRRETFVALIGGRDVIVDACSVQWRDRQPWLAMAERLKVKTRLVVFTTSVDVCRVRDDMRSRTAGRIDVYAARMRAALRLIEREGWDSIARVAGEGG